MHFHRPLQETVPTADAATPAATAATDAAAAESTAVTGTAVDATFAVAQPRAVRQLQSRADSRDHRQELAQALSRPAGQGRHHLLLLSLD